MREDQETQKHTLYLYRGDFTELRDLYGDDIGAGAIIRRLVRKHIEEYKLGKTVKLKEMNL